MNNYFKDINDPLEITNTNIILENKVPDEMPKYTPEDIFSTSLRSSEPFGSIKEMVLRDEFINLGMFGFVSWKWLNPFAEWIGSRKCLEIMSGRGWLSYALRSKGVNTIATDNFSWHKNEQFQLWNETVTNVENIDAVSAIKKYGKDVDIVIVSWPEPGDTTFNSLKTLNNINPDALFIFIGEWEESVCANNDFFNSFKVINDPKFDAVSSNFQSWFGIKDRIYLGKYSK